VITAVLDTTVLASGIVTFGRLSPPAEILKAWEAGDFQLIVSEHILAELKSTLEKPYFQKYINSQQVAGTISLFKEEAVVTPITYHVSGVATHSEDDLIIATVLSAKADYLVTGDKPLLQKAGTNYQRVRLLTPLDFIKVIRK